MGAGITYTQAAAGSQAAPEARVAALPLCIDLDGTLVCGDTLHEQLLRALLKHPLRTLLACFALLSGKAAFKRALSEVCPIDPGALVYRADLLDYLARERAEGRTLVLATAADTSIAAAVADHLKLFDHVVASDGRDNLKGPRKAERLAALFGRGGFGYAGDSRSDVPVWAQAGEIVLVNASPSVEALIVGPVSQRFGVRRASLLRLLLKELRVYQWVKNGLVFLPALLAHALLRPDVLRNSLLTFVAFSMTASAIYVINDLLDLDSDRNHPRKRNRPFASGDLPLHFGLVGPALLVLGLGVACALVSLPTFAMLLVYIAVTTTYSAFLKTKPLVDVFTLAGLYTIRLLTGGIATRLPVSIWLLGFSLFAFLSLAFLKRAAELASARADATKANARRGYRLGDDTLLQIMGVSSAFTASLVLSLYLNSDAAREHYPVPMWLWLVVPLQLFAQCRLWMSAGRGYMTDDPIVYAFKDWVCQLVIACVFVVFVLATRGPHISWF